MMRKPAGRALMFGSKSAGLPLPIQANYIGSQDLTAAYWQKGGFTAPNSTTLMETAVNNTHNIVPATSIARTAAAKTFTAFAEAAPVNGRQFMQIQVASGNYAGYAAAVFDVINGTFAYSYNDGTVFSNAGNALVTPVPGSSAFRCQFDFQSDSASTGFNFLLYSMIDNSTNSFLGDITKGLTARNLWLFNKNAGAGGL